MSEYKIRAVVGFEGSYQVDTDGNIFSIARNGRSGRFLKQILKGNGYLYVGLRKWGETKQELVHRIVAKAFIPNTECKPQVNHIDENKLNNCVDNLEWVTEKENIHHATGLKRMGIAHGIDVRVFFPDGKIKEFNSIREASSDLFNGSITKLNTGRVLSNYADSFDYEGYRIEIIKTKHKRRN